jgi:hypothetical protein
MGHQDQSGEGWFVSQPDVEERSIPRTFLQGRLLPALTQCWIMYFGYRQ